MIASILHPLKRPELRRVVGAQFLAEAADGVVSAALPLYVYAETGSAVLMTTAASLQMIGGAVGGLAGGVLADRYDRQVVLRRTFLLRAVLLAAAFLVGPVGAVVSLAVLARALGQVDNPSFDSLMPALATEGDVQQVMALRRFVQSVSIILGPAIGALATVLIGGQRTLGVAAAMFVIAAVIHLTIRGIDRGLAERRAAHGHERWTRMVRSTTIIFTTPYVRRMVAYWFGSIVTVAMAMGAAVVWFEDDIGRPEWYGLSLSAWGIGSALGALLFGGRRFRLSFGRITLYAAPVYAVWCALPVAAELFWLLPLAWLLWGISFGPEVVTGDPEFVARLPRAQLGRAYAGLGVVLMLGMAAGYAITGPLLDAFGARTTTLIAAAATLAVGLVWLLPRPVAAHRAVALPPATASADRDDEWNDSDDTDDDIEVIPPGPPGDLPTVVPR